MCCTVFVRNILLWVKEAVLFGKWTANIERIFWVWLNYCDNLTLAGKIWSLTLLFTWQQEVTVVNKAHSNKKLRYRWIPVFMPLRDFDVKIISFLAIFLNRLNRHLSIKQWKRYLKKCISIIRSQSGRLFYWHYNNKASLVVADQYFLCFDLSLVRSSKSWRLDGPLSIILISSSLTSSLPGSGWDSGRSTSKH